MFDVYSATNKKMTFFWNRRKSGNIILRTLDLWQSLFMTKKIFWEKQINFYFLPFYFMETVQPVAFVFDVTKFSEVDGAIQEIATNASMLRITDIESKEQFDRVHEMRMKLVKMRTQGIDKIEAEVKAPHLAFTKAVGEEANKRREQLKAIEKDLQAEEDKVNAHKEAIRAEKARKAQEKIQERVNRMAGVGGCTDMIILWSLTDEEFEAEFIKAEKIYEEKKRQEEADKLRIAEEKAKQEAEAQRLREQAEELARQQEAMRKQQEDLDRQKAEAERIIRDEQDRKQAEAQRIIDEENARKKAESDRIEKERQEKEAKELEENKKPDREKLIAYIEAMQNIPKPEVSEETAVRYLSQIQWTLWQAMKLVTMY